MSPRLVIHQAFSFEIQCGELFFFYYCLRVGECSNKQEKLGWTLAGHTSAKKKAQCTTFERKILVGIEQFIWVRKQREVQHQSEITEEFLLFACLNFARAQTQNLNFCC